MARCPDCNKFVSFEEVEPEVNSLEVDSSGYVTAEIRIVNECADCSTELREANLDLSANADFEEAWNRHLEETKNNQPLSDEERLVESGCPKHVEDHSCSVCGWDGKLQPSRWKDISIKKFDPPTRLSELGWKGQGGEKEIIAVIHSGTTTTWVEKDDPKEIKMLEEYERMGTSQPPPEKLPKYAPDLTVHELEIEEESSERTNRTEGKGRGRKTFYGASVEYRVNCSCKGFEFAGILEDDIQASGMDDLT